MAVALCPNMATEIQPSSIHRYANLVSEKQGVCYVICSIPELRSENTNKTVWQSFEHNHTSLFKSYRLISFPRLKIQEMPAMIFYQRLLDNHEILEP